MAEQTRLVTIGLLSNKAFRQDLEKFLSLSKTQLQHLNSISQGPDGFWPTSQSLPFSEKAAIPLENARAVLQIAEYLYERCREQSLSAEEAVSELIEIGKSLKVKDIEEKQEVLGGLLATKEAFEQGRRARLQATEIIAHFTDLEGIWDLRPIFDRETREIVTKLPVLIVNITWHDSTHTNHEAVFQLDEEDWQKLKDKIDKLDQQLRAVQRDIERT